MNTLMTFIFALLVLMIVSFIDAVTLMDEILNVTYNHSLIRFALCDSCQLNYHMFDTGVQNNVTLISHNSWTQDKFRVILPPKNVDVICGDMSSQDAIQKNHLKQSTSRNDEKSNHTHFDHKIDFNDAFLVRARIGHNCTLSSILRNIHSLNQLIQLPVRIRYLLLPERYLGVALNYMKMETNEVIPISRQYRLLPSSKNENKTLSFGVHNIPNLLFLPQDRFDDLDSFINVKHNLNQWASPFLLEEENARWDLFYKISDLSPGVSSEISGMQNIILQQSDDKSDDQQKKANRFHFIYIPFATVWFIILCTICCYKVSTDREKLELMAANRRREVELNRLRSMNVDAESERIGMTREEFDSLPHIYYHSNIITFTGVDMSIPTVPQEKTDAEAILDMMNPPISLNDPYANSKQPDHSVAEPLLHNDDHSIGYANEDSATKVIETDVENNQTLDPTNQSFPDTNPVSTEADITTTTRPLPGRMDSISDGACPVCVEDFQENELIIRLPKCRHLYHIQCLEMWLVGKKSDFCPLCKEVVLEQKEDEKEEDTNDEALDRSDLNA